ncbi:hypothetical protein [Tersicoccus sp. Bi-70]|uniref:hypothetical protein n=1 Tax=Tersicoccus sp. Bi-70 TaxID=1897634 RepID=UPI000977E9E8|nr:hypothetical protein [Tersicoccus sp. Bi-70]OMH34425.1 hypothetical protein BGP79_04815 [Tersicoccus sp. Bi-70]
MGQDPLENDRIGSRRPETTTPGSPGSATGRTTASATVPGSAAASSREATGRAAQEGIGQDQRQRAVAGPFTVRDLTVLGSIVVLLIGSVIPLVMDVGNGYNVYANLWNIGSSAQIVVFGLMLPLVVGALFIARRLSGKEEILRVGSLSLDQFASVVASVATVFHFLSVANFFQAGPIIALIGALGMLVATVGGPHIPGFASDFVVRPSVEARLVARPAVPAYQAPKPEKPESDTSSAGTSSGTSSGTVAGSAARPVGGNAAGTRRDADENRATAGGTAGTGSDPGAMAAGAGLGAGAAGAAGAFTGRNAGSTHGDDDTDTSTDTDEDTRVTGSSSSLASSSPETSSLSSSATRSATTRDDVDTDTSDTDGSDTDSADTDDALDGTDTTGSDAADTDAPGQAHDARTTAVPTVTGAEHGSTGHHDDRGDDAADLDDTVARPITTDAVSTGADDDDMTAIRPQQWQTADAVWADDADTVARPAVRDAEPPTQQTELTDDSRANERSAGGRGASAVSAPIGAVVDPEDDADGHETDDTGRGRADEYEAFWFAVGYARPVFDERSGQQQFMLEPGAWILALQDRGSSFVVQHTDGRVAVLHDLNSIERA